MSQSNHQTTSQQVPGRKRSYRRSTLLVASAVAFSLPTVSAFQNNREPMSAVSSHPRVSMMGDESCNRINCSSRSVTQLHVVTDPKEIISMDVPDSDGVDRRTIEEMYCLQTLDLDGLMGEMIEGDPSQRKQNGSRRKKSKMKRASSVSISSYSHPSKTSSNTAKSMQMPTETGDTPSTRRVQFRGLSTTPNSRGGRKRATLSKNQPTPNSSKPFVHGSHDSGVSSSRSSTMPGFANSGFRTSRQRAYQDGIRIAEQRSGKKFVESEDARKTRRQLNGEAMYKTSASVPDSLVQFANEIHEVDRITPKEEIALGELTQEAIRVQKIYDGLELRLQREPTDEEWCAASGKINMEALSEAIEEGLEAKNKLVTSNLRMVQGVVNVYIRNGLRGQYNAGDLMQEGIMALIRAAEKFDPARGFRFSTYAMYWIRSAIKRDQLLQSRVIAVPQRLHDNYKKLRRIQNELTETLGRRPTKDELCDAVGLSEGQVDRCLEAMSQREYSLDQEVWNPKKAMTADRSGDTMYEILDSKTDDEAHQKQSNFYLREDLIKTLQRNLSVEEVELLLLRYGLSENITLKQAATLKNGPLTIAEVSRVAGLKPDKVRRMINRSLKHLKAVIGDEWYEYERELK